MENAERELPSAHAAPDVERTAIPWSLFAAAVVQVVLLGAVTIRPMIERVWWVRDRPAVVRSARLSYGAEFGDFILFLRDAVPEDGLVVIPPISSDVVLGNMGFMQYFLFPRRLTNCPDGQPWEACRIHYGGAKTYVLAIGDFPPRDRLGLDMVYLEFDGLRGVYAPAVSP